MRTILPFAWKDKMQNTSGVFLEVGGNDGIQGSNTLFLERCLQWRGLMIEAHPAYFEAMTTNRPGLVGISSALCEKKGHATFTAEASERSMLEDLDHVNEHGNGISVPCNRLDDILDVLAIDHIDVFSLDVEGAELEVVKSIDWSKASFGVMIVEDNYFDWDGDKHTQITETRRIIEEAGQMPLLFTHCWNKWFGHITSCDSYYGNPRFIDVEGVQQAFAADPPPTGWFPLIEEGSKVNECRRDSGGGWLNSNA